ncbi:uncharacterized protein PV09_02114 [Verruconis gallopava]|uniref:Thymocyte nuclear protein 1 n=1 Tax=Verruconis gallopava TaxID=253628 RepID=A0A0D2B7N5_9PEZI|nr:uncharacterized protein PV09_02114 [Verruconis gallopava]KIW07259.1 hypothetical protein PV09_02114 [Verruconis gallopava]
MPPRRNATGATSTAKNTATAKSSTARKAKAESTIATKTTRGKRTAEPEPIEDEPPAMKPARGRKTTKADAPTVEAVAVEIPKKRGRTAKAPPVTPIEEEHAVSGKGKGRGKAKVEEVPVSEVEKSAPEPKKRGRQAKAAPVIAADGPSSTAQPGKRGRTAKKQIQEELEDALSDVAVSKRNGRTSKRIEKELPITSEAGTKSKRGRATARGKAQEENAPEPEAPKAKGRGKRTEIKEAEDESTADTKPKTTKTRSRKAKTESEKNSEAEPKAKLVKTRSKHFKATDSDEPMPEPQPDAETKPKSRGKRVKIADPEVEETEEPAPPVPKGRGRKAAPSAPANQGKKTRGKTIKRSGDSQLVLEENHIDEESTTSKNSEKVGERKKASLEPQGSGVEEPIARVVADTESSEYPDGIVEMADEPMQHTPKAAAKGRRQTVGGEVTPTSKSQAQGMVSSAPPKSHGSPLKRPSPSGSAGESAESPAKRAKVKAAEIATPQNKPSRRRTLAATKLTTPRTSKSVPVPGTAPAKAHGRPPRSSAMKSPLTPAATSDVTQEIGVADDAAEASIGNMQLPESTTKPSRRRTLAVNPTTPKNTQTMTIIPGTAPPKAVVQSSTVQILSEEESETAGAEDAEDTQLDHKASRSKTTTQFPEAKDRPSRRKTLDAKLHTPSNPKTTIGVPGTAPSKAVGRPLKNIGSSEAVTPETSRAVPKVPKTVQPKKVEKAAAGKRKRASSPGPASRKSRRATSPSSAAEKRKSIKSSDIPAGPGGVSYWLMKAEPESRLENGVDVKFSIDDLKAVTEPEPWTGVRNHQAKNNMMAMKKGDLAIFYHSSCAVPGAVGIMEIVEEATVDETAFDENSPYYDAKSSRETPRWFNVKVEFRSKFANPSAVTLAELRKRSLPGEPLQNMQLFTQSRLSVSKVSPEEWEYILKMAGESAPKSLYAPAATSTPEETDKAGEEAETAAEGEGSAGLTGDASKVVDENVDDVATEVVGQDASKEIKEDTKEQIENNVAQEAQGETADTVAERMENVAAETDVPTVQEAAVEISGAMVPTAVAPSIEFPIAREAISNDLSELPDASFTTVDDETLDRLADLPPIQTTGRRSMSPRKTPTDRRTSLKPNGTSSKPASSVGSRASSLGPVPSFAPDSATEGDASRRSPRAPSLGTAAKTVETPDVSSSPLKAIEKTSVAVASEQTSPVVDFSPAVPFTAGGGGTFAVPDETDDSSMFFTHTSPTQRSNPDIGSGSGDNSFGL